MSNTQITAEPGMPQIIITREFDAPGLVFRAYTEPELLAQWLGPRDLTMTVERHEVRDGGRWRYLHTDAQGNTYGFHGVFHGDPSPDAIVQTFEFEGVPGHVKLDATTLERRGGATITGAWEGQSLPVTLRRLRRRVMSWRDVRLGHNRTRPPPFMGWRGPCATCRTSLASCPACPAATAAPPGPGTRAIYRFPGSSHVPGVSPWVAPVSGGECISTPVPSRSARGGGALIESFFAVHSAAPVIRN